METTEKAMSNAELCGLLEGLLRRAGEAMLQSAGTPTVFSEAEEDSAATGSSIAAEEEEGEEAQAVTVQVTAEELAAIGAASERCRAVELLDLLIRGHRQAAAAKAAEAASDEELAALAVRSIGVDGSVLGVEEGSVYSGEAAKLLHRRLKERQTRETAQADAAKQLEKLTALSCQAGKPFRPV